MKFLFDLFPIILFFIVFKLYGIYEATAAAILATLAQVGWAYLKSKKIEKTLWINLGLIIVFGGATLLLRDETFIKWKPTVLYWVFSTAIICGHYVFRRNIIRMMMGKNMSLPDTIWVKVNFSWAIFFFLMGLLNILFAFNFSTDTWVNFKLFGGMGLLLAFAILQALLLAKYMEKQEEINDKKSN